MAEERHGNGNRGGGKSFGSRRPGARGGKGFKPRGGGKGHSFGHGRRDGEGFHKGPRRDGFRKDFHRDDGHRSFHKEGEHRDGERRQDGERRGYRKDFHRDGEHRGGFRKDFHKGPRRDGFRKDFHRDDRHDDRRDGEAREERQYRDRDGQRRDDRGYRGDRKDYGQRGYGEKDFHRGDRKSGYDRPRRDGDDRRDGGNPRYRHDDHRRPFNDHRGGNAERKPWNKDERKDSRTAEREQQGEERREFNREERQQWRERKREEYMSKPRRNSDGTVSYPSQNPYTDRRPGEPKMPKGLTWSMLSTDERERLRGLSKEHAENVGLHILAAYSLEQDDPQAALEHAQWAARQASRVDFAREALAFVAYRQGKYKLALREFRTAYRMNGYLDYLPLIADCERGVGHPKKAVEIALSDDARGLNGEAKAEMFLVYAGALGDLKLWDKAIEIAHQLGRSKGLPGAYRMRAVQAEQYFLEQAGRDDEAVKLDDLLDRLEAQYAEEDEDEQASDDIVIDYDLEHLPEDLMEDLGISEDDAQYAPEDPEQEDDETELPAQETEEGAQADQEPQQTQDQADADASEQPESDDKQPDTDESAESDTSAEPAQAADETDNTSETADADAIKDDAAQTDGDQA